MPTQITGPRNFKLYIPDLDNHILVESHGGEIVIHASRDNFSEQRKASFVRLLAMEGYIPDGYEWFCEPQAGGSFGLRWVVDCSWSESDPQIERRARRRELGVILLGLGVFVMLRWWMSPHVF
jgi:hypothetical protein